MRILVTGSNGLLGSAIKRLAPGAPEHEFVFDHRVDLRSPEKARALLESSQPQCIIQCAARVGGVKMNKENPETLFHDNILVNANLIHVAAEIGTQKFVAFGSNCAYGDVPELRTDNIHDGQPYANNRAYAYAKRMIDIHLSAAAEQYGMASLYVVPVSMFGPNDNFNLENAHVIPALIHRCFLAKNELRVWGDGSAVREVVYSEDVARIILGLIGTNVERVVIGSGLHVSVKEMAETIAKQTGLRGKIVWETDKPAGQKTRPPAESYPFAFTPFDEAIRRTCSWFKDHYPHIRK